MDSILKDVDSAKRKAIKGVIALVALFTVFEYFRPPKLGQALRGEWNIWTMGMATLDYTVAFLAFMCAVMALYMARKRILSGRIWIAWLFVAGAFQYFVLDETLQYHERMGGALLDMKPSLFHLRPHNMVEASYCIGAVVLTVIILRSIRNHRQFLRFYMTGLVIMAVQTVLGVLPTSIAWPIYDRLPPAFPELLEISALTCFVCGFISLGADYVKRIAEWIIHEAKSNLAAEHVLSMDDRG